MELGFAPKVVLAIVLCCALLLLLGLKGPLRILKKTPDDSETSSGSRANDSRKLPLNSADVHYSLVDGTEFVWQRVKKPRALLFLAHGCQHSATDWWDKSPACPTCIGLPEEKRIVRSALKHHYVPLAISSKDRTFSRCWTEDDVEPVKRTVQRVLKETRMPFMPVFALGASSGGAFLPVLAQAIKLAGLAIQIMATHADLLSSKFPPTVFIHMPRDRNTAQHVEANVQALRSVGVPAQEWPANPVPLSETFFSDRIDTINKDLSHRIYRALILANYLTPKDILKEDPRHSKWREVLVKEIPELKEEDLKPDQSAIAEVLNVAWAMHEITADLMDETMEFFNSLLNPANKSK